MGADSLGRGPLADIPRKRKAAPLERFPSGAAFRTSTPIELAGAPPPDGQTAGPSCKPAALGHVGRGVDAGDGSVGDGGGHLTHLLCADVARGEDAGD